jgi:hypothetical protein
MATLAWAPNTINNLKALALRTNSEEYVLQYDSYKIVLQFLQNQSAINNHVLIVKLTPSLFPPESNKKYKIEEFWGPYIQWSDSPDLIIFGSINTPRGRSTPSDSPEYKSFLMEREGYAKHVVERGGSCVLKPCFEKALLLPNGGEILVLVR